jgi:hypothetical protein
MHIPQPNQQSTIDNTKDIMIDDERFFGYCTEFKNHLHPLTQRQQQRPAENQPSKQSILCDEQEHI